MIRNYKECPGKPALFFGVFGSIAIAQWIHHAFFFGSDDRLRLIFTIIATMAATYAHSLVYNRKHLRSLRDELLALGIVAAGFGAGIWTSFAYFNDDSFLRGLPILAGLFAAAGVDALVRRKFRKA